MPHNYFDQFLGTEVCMRKLLGRLCSNALFIMCGFDRQNLNVVRTQCGLQSRTSSQTHLIVLTPSHKSGSSQELSRLRTVPTALLQTTGKSQATYCPFQFPLWFPFKTGLTFSWNLPSVTERNEAYWAGPSEEQYINIK